MYSYAGFFIKNESILKDVETIVGSSAGALWGMLYAFGYSPTKILEALLSVNLKEVLKPSAVSFVRHYGIYQLDSIREALLELVDGRDLTFEEIDCDLAVAAYCLNLTKTIYFSKNNTPGVKVIDAVMASMCVPALVPPVKINGMYYVDGGFADVWPADPVIHVPADQVLKVVPAFPLRHNVEQKMENIADYFKLVLKGAVKHRYRCDLRVPEVVINIPEEYDMFDFSSDYDTLLKISLLGSNLGYFLDE